MTVATVTKLIGSGQVYTTLQGWEDGAPVNYTTAERWTAGTFIGTFTQGETVTGTGLTAGKFLDSDGSSYVTFGIVTGNSATLVTLTGSTSGATCVVSSKTDTGIIWQGKINAASDVFSSATQLLAIGGGTVSTTCYAELTTNTGASFRDNASVQSNPLRADSTKGTCITLTGNYTYAVALNQLYCRLSNLQLVTTQTGAKPIGGNQGSATFANATLDNLIYESNTTNAFYSDTIGFGATGTSLLRNSILINRLATSDIINSGGNLDVINCTLVCPSDKGPCLRGITRSAGTVTAKNVAIFGATADVSGTVTATTCYTSDASPSTGFTTLTYDNSAFVATTDAARDFRLLTGSGLLDVGTTDTTNAATDIVGTARPQSSAYDVGCWELVVAGGGSSADHQLANAGLIDRGLVNAGLIGVSQ